MNPISHELPPPVLHTRDDRGVHTLALNRASTSNALSQDMLAALQAALDFIALDATARLVVIAASGRAFCAGHHLKDMRANPELAYYQRLFSQCTRMMLSIQNLPVSLDVLDTELEAVISLIRSKLREALLMGKALFC